MNKYKDPDEDDEIIPEPVKKINPFDIENKTPFDILYECGRHSLPASHAISILRGHISHTSLQDLSHAILDPDSPEMESYNDGYVVGQAEMSASLRQSTIDNEKDAYKSMNNEDRQRTINQAIHKNFGIGE